MARNMSHNIGSHVLSKLANLDYKSVKKFLEKEEIEDESYWINQNKIFYGYLQKRMEFIADISTADTIITNSSLFQKEILNKLKPTPPLPPGLDRIRPSGWATENAGIVSNGWRNFSGLLTIALARQS